MNSRQAKSIPPVVLTAVNFGIYRGRHWRTQIGDWEIKEPLEKLRAKYTRGGSLLFNHYATTHRLASASDLTETDLFAVHALMNGTMKRNRTWEELRDPGLLARAASLFDTIPRDATILDPEHDYAVEDLIELFSEVHGVKLAVATKILALKRPELVPMMDSTLRACFNSSTPTEILAGMRRLLERADLQASLDQLRARLLEEFHVRVGRLRVLDELIWFDWNLDERRQGVFPVRGFAEWAFDPRAPSRGVFRR